MSPDRLFADTVYLVGQLSTADQWHAVAVAWRDRALDAREIWTTEPVLLEVVNGLSARWRVVAERFVRAAYRTPRMHVVPLTTDLVLRGLDLFRDRPDKRWSLTDCISFVVMADNGLTEALTSDIHFQQAGFRALLLDTP